MTLSSSAAYVSLAIRVELYARETADAEAWLVASDAWEEAGDEVQAAIMRLSVPGVLRTRYPRLFRHAWFLSRVPANRDRLTVISREIIRQDLPEFHRWPILPHRARSLQWAIHEEWDRQFALNLERANTDPYRLMIGNIEDSE